MTARTMTDDEFERYFDEGGDTTAFMLEGSLRQPGREIRQRKINLTMPDWMIEYLDKRARETAVSRQAVINTWVAERIQEERTRELLA